MTSRRDRARGALVVSLAAVLTIAAGCASPLTVAEPREGATTPGFGDAGPLDSGEAGDADFIGDPPEDAGPDAAEDG